MSYPALLWRTLRALPFGILMGCLCGSLSFSVTWIADDPSSWLHWLLAPFGALLLAPFAMLFAAPPALVIGVPAYALLARLGWARAWSAGLLGAVVAALIGSPLGWGGSAYCGFYGACIAYFLHRACQAGVRNHPS